MGKYLPGMRAPTRAERREFRKVYKPRKKKITMGRIFRTKRGILGCYKYVNGKRVGFVRKYRR